MVRFIDLIMLDAFYGEAERQREREDYARGIEDLDFAIANHIKKDKPEIDFNYDEDIPF